MKQVRFLWAPSSVTKFREYFAIFKKSGKIERFPKVSFKFLHKIQYFPWIFKLQNSTFSMIFEVSVLKIQFLKSVSWKRSFHEKVPSEIKENFVFFFRFCYAKKNRFFSLFSDLAGSFIYDWRYKVWNEFSLSNFPRWTGCVMISCFVPLGPLWLPCVRSFLNPICICPSQSSFTLGRMGRNPVKLREPETISSIRI